MAVRLTHVCDPCSDLGDENEGSQQTIRIGDAAGLLDLCARHEAELVAPLRDLLLEYGRTEDGKAVKPRKSPTAAVGAEAVPCPIEGCDRGPYSSRGSMMAHLRDLHNTTEAEVLGLADHVCDVRGCARAFGSIQALSVHKARMHPPKPKKAA